MICPNCQTENPEGSFFCFECGQPLAENGKSEPESKLPQEMPTQTVIDITPYVILVLGFVVIVFLVAMIRYPSIVRTTFSYTVTIPVYQLFVAFLILGGIALLIGAYMTPRD